MPLLGLCVLGRVRKHTSSGQTRQALPPSAWFDNLVHKHKLEEWLRPAPRQRSDPKDQCACDVFVLVERGEKYEGPLTPFNQQELFLWDCLGKPYAVSSLRIKHGITLQRPAVVARPSHLKVPIWSPGVPASDIHLRGTDIFTRQQSVNEPQICDALCVSAEELRSFIAEPVCLAIPEVILQLIRKGLWDTLMVCANWHQKRRGKAYLAFADRLFLSTWHEEMKACGALDRLVAAPTLVFSQSDAYTLAHRLQHWAADILERHSSDDADFAAEHLFLEEMVLKLQAFSSVASMNSNRSGRKQPKSHDSVVRALCACLNVRDRSKLQPFVLEGMKAAFPGFDADVHCDLPSGSVLSRRQLVVDCAFACFWRQLLADHDGCVYLWADSSPQGGVDWLLSIIVLIKRENLEEVAEAADALQGSAERFVAACELDDTHAMMQIAQQRHACGLVLTKGMQRHRQIPMALGSGRSSLEHKVRCICQKFYAESQSLPALKKNLGRVRSVCTDMGTEMGLPQMEGASLESLIPSYMLEDAGLFSEEAAGQAEHCANFLLPEALLAPGILHIVHNMMKDTDSNLSFWKTWIPGLKAIAKLLHEDHLRQRLVATCIKGTPFEWLEEHFQKGVPQPIEWRWGTVTAIVEHVLSVRSAIQAIWNPAVFGKGESEERERTEGADALNVDTITEAVRSKKWWLQTQLVLDFHKFGEGFSSWAEGCECHGFLRPVDTGDVHLRRKTKASTEAAELRAARGRLGLASSHEGDGVGFTCPLAGCRAPDLACGAAKQHFEELGDNQLHRLRQAGIDLGVEASDIVEVLDAAVCCRASMQSYMSQKLQCWQVLPWKLCGIAHHNTAKSRQCAAECLQLFRESPHEEQLHHRLTWVHLREGAPTRVQLESYVQGTRLQDLPDLKSLVYELKFVPTVERVQEADHSIVHRSVQYKGVRGPYVSCALRLPEIRALMQHEDQYKSFLARFAEVEDMNELAKRFGFYKHERWQVACHEKHHKKRKIILAAAILYSSCIRI